MRLETALRFLEGAVRHFRTIHTTYHYRWKVSCTTLEASVAMRVGEILPPISLIHLLYLVLRYASSEARAGADGLGGRCRRVTRTRGSGELRGASSEGLHSPQRNQKYVPLFQVLLEGESISAEVDQR
jgi:hypothetical protein